MTAATGGGPTAPVSSGPGLLTDRYELTMLSAFVEDGSAANRAVFECFGRRLPRGRRYGVVAGVGRLASLLADFSFSADEIDWLSAHGVVTPAAADYLRDFRFRGDVDAYREGEIYFPGSPLVTVSGTLGECIVLETLILSVLNHDSAIASAAARMVVAAEGRPLVEMGSRRTHEEAAVAAARAAYIAGFASTSNLAAGYRYGIPTAGTAAHAFVLAHRDERAAFASQIAAQGPGTTLLVDTYDIEQGIRNAVAVAGPDLGAIRIDSGDLGEEAHRARALLDALGAANTRIMVTGDLDEYVIAALAAEPIDGYGVGTRVATGSGHPTAGLVYKLVAIGDSSDDGPMRAVTKTAKGKVSAGGRKSAYRVIGARGFAVQELTFVGDREVASDARALQVPVLRAGSLLPMPDLDAVRRHHVAARAELPRRALAISDGDAALIATATGGGVR